MKLSEKPTPQEVRDYYDLHTGEGTINFSNDESSIDLWHALNQTCESITQLEERVRELEEELSEIQQIASSRGLDSQATYDSVLEDIEDRCLEVLKGKS